MGLETSTEEIKLGKRMAEQSMAYEVEIKEVKKRIANANRTLTRLEKALEKDKNSQSYFKGVWGTPFVEKWVKLLRKSLNNSKSSEAKQ